MHTGEAARRWIGGWGRAWPTGDADGIAGMYTEAAPYRSHPFRELDTARTYAERAFGEEDLIEAWFGEPVVEGDRAAVEYWAILQPPGGDEVTIAGASFLRFDEDGLVVEQRDYWDQLDGRRDPPAGWGR